MLLERIEPLIKTALDEGLTNNEITVIVENLLKENIHLNTEEKNNAESI